MCIDRLSDGSVPHCHLTEMLPSMLLPRGHHERFKEVFRLSRIPVQLPALCARAFANSRAGDHSPLEVVALTKHALDNPL